MHTFEYLLKTKVIHRDIAAKVETLGEYKGKQDLYLHTKPDALNVLRETVINQSTVASSAIEGISTPPHRLEALLASRTGPRDRPEEEIAGYKGVLRAIEDLSDPNRTSITPDTILQMHKDLHKYTNAPGAGRWKSKDNVIEMIAAKGKTLGIIFHPPAAAVTPRFMEALCRHLARMHTDRTVPVPIIIAAFVFDFLCIHPFDDGNGRIARLLTHLLLLQEGYLVGRYVPLERLIFETKDAYSASLRASTEGWHDAVHDPDPWTRYLLDVFIRAYGELEKRVEVISSTAAPMGALIRDAALSRRQFAVPELRVAFPDASRAYIFRVMKELVDGGHLRRVGRGKYIVT